MCKLSIIVPIYNSEMYLVECIESILNQNFREFELILINDGSTDSSAEICEIYAKLDNRIKVRHKSNGGQSTARNNGIDIAIGDFIGFVDSDDWIHKEMYEIMVEHAIAYNSDIVACNIMLMNQNGSFKPYNELSINYELSRNEAMEEIYQNKILTFSPCNKIYRLNLFNSIRFKEGTILEDIDLAYKIVYKANRISYLSNLFYYYRFNINSTLRGKLSHKRIEDEYTVRKEMYEFYLRFDENISRLLYYDFCKIRSYLYYIAVQNLPKYKYNYNYLIKFEKRILISLFLNKKFSFKNKIRVAFLIGCPKTEFFVRRIMYSLKKDELI